MPLLSANTRPKENRCERDSLGYIGLPQFALYGAQTARAIRNYPISGRKSHPAVTRAFLQIKLAAARANYHCGVLSRYELRLISNAIEYILKCNESDWLDFFPVDPYQAGAGTSQNMNFNEVIANCSNLALKVPLGTYSPIHPNDQVNKSQSTNDVYPTVIRLALLDVSKEQVTSVMSLSRAFKRCSEKWARIPKSGRTHLQDAVPMFLGDEVGGYASTLNRCGAWLEKARGELLEIGIGGSAVGNRINVPKPYPNLILKALRKETGYDFFLSRDFFEMTQSQAQLSYFSAIMRTLCLELTRICNDLRLLASGPNTGLGELKLPAVQPGSSIMPGKINPSILEMVNQACYSALGFDQTVALCSQAGQLELNVMTPMMAYSLIESTVVLTHAIQVLEESCIKGITPQLTQLRKYSESTAQVATSLSPSLGYAQVAELVRESTASGVPVMELARKKSLAIQTWEAEGGKIRK
ncbi:unnamed protein product [Sphagnum jensenii]|uniref:Fumarate lyase N-terminal domain-containing protein n=1 Tax=Sphagnum jensenii TaxID=128206 RepID=A0ABP0VG76_9BRYO